MFGVKNMNPEEYESDFKPWHDERKKRTDWNFKHELVKYCRADVELLSKAVLHFRTLFRTSLDTDPFRYTTQASLCMSVYLNKFFPREDNRWKQCTTEGLPGLSRMAAAFQQPKY